MTTVAGERCLVVSFPAAGAGGATLDQLEKLVVRRGMGYVALANPESIDALASGEWLAGCVDTIRSVAQSSADWVVLFGHCMGGLSAVRLSYDLGSTLALPVRVLAVNTPCPDSSGLIPTMSQFSDAQIAEVLAHDGFPPEVLEDEDLLAEVADGLREDARVADRLAEWINSAGSLDSLHLLSTRGDRFIPPEHCAGWWQRVAGEFHLTIADGGHTLDEASVGLLERAFDSLVASVRAEAA